MLVSSSHDLEIRKRRVALRGPVRVASKDGLDASTMEYVDLSTGGLFVETMYPLRVGSELEIGFRLQNITFRARATVAWVRAVEKGPDEPMGMGVCFGKLSPLQKKALYSEVADAIRNGAPAKAGTPPAPGDVAARGKKSKKGSSLWSRLTGALGQGS